LADYNIKNPSDENRTHKIYEKLEEEGSCEWYVPVTICGTIAIEKSLKGLHY